MKTRMQSRLRKWLGIRPRVRAYRPALRLRAADLMFALDLLGEG